VDVIGIEEWERERERERERENKEGSALAKGR
jgi:hypothetical protein